MDSPRADPGSFQYRRSCFLGGIGLKIILLEEVRKVGKKGDVVEVSDAYARNVLIKQKKALEATKENQNSLKLKQKNEEKIAAENLEEAKAQKEKLDSAQVTVRVKTGENGRLFGSISSKEIADAAKEQLGLELDRKKIVLENPIKSIGEMAVTVKLHPQVRAELKVKVESL
jgi:large subunit ribosomal protein L9